MNDPIQTNSPVHIFWYSVLLAIFGCSITIPGLPSQLDFAINNTNFNTFAESSPSQRICTQRNIIAHIRRRPWRWNKQVNLFSIFYDNWRQTKMMGCIDLSNLAQAYLYYLALWMRDIHSFLSVFWIALRVFLKHDHIQLAEWHLQTRTKSEATPSSKS